ncbi:MAG TPA: glycosyltransferase family 39 protein, partial [Candidatus Tectomicrobia bacterium]|nr:glycosyltransferase family 39 protein [Candidatus Tectomicrobia bacterium]
MSATPLAVALLAVGLMYLVGLGTAPFLDPPEGFHAAVARGMLATGDWITPQVNGVPYFDKPPLLYWLMAAGFAGGGVSEWTARLWPALSAIGVAAVTARLGAILANPRVGLLAALMVSANLGIFLMGRIVKPDMPFILCIVLAYAGFAVAYKGGGRAGLALFYGALGLAAITKDVLGAIGPLVTVALFLWLTRERPLALWAPWWGVGLLLAVALPWYAAVEAAHRGFLWYTVVDTHLLGFTRQRVFPDEDVPLGSLEFLGVSLAAFLPWTLSLPWAYARALRRPWRDAGERLWLLFALWPVVVVGVFTVSAFKLPHYALPAFPALALLVARVWDETID